MTIIQTKRLLLRSWNEDDFEPFFKMNSDPRVMEFMPALLTREESSRLASRFKEFIERNGWGFWAVSLLDEDEFIGFIGLNQVQFSAPFTPAVEVGWRLAYDYWGKGYAPEGAKVALQYGFDTLNQSEIVSFTAMQNMLSRRVMEKLGMHHNDQEDFEHPRLPESHPLRRHVLYRITSNEWSSQEKPY